MMCACFISGRRSVYLIWLLFIVCAVAGKAQSGIVAITTPTTMENKPPEPLVVRLFQPSDTLNGVEWRGRDPGRRNGMAFVGGPVTLVFRYGVKEGTVDALNLFVREAEGHVVDVQVRPLWEPMPMAQLIDRINGLMKQWGVDLGDQAKADLARWRKANPTARRFALAYTTNTAFDDTSDLFLRVSHSGDKGWYVVFEFGARSELRTLVRKQEDWTKWPPRMRQPVWLDQPVEQVFAANDWPDSKQWPLDGDGKPARAVEIYTVRILVYKRRGQEVFAVPRAHSILRQLDDRVVEIVFLPLWPIAPLPDAVDQLQQAMRQWGILPNQRLTDDLKLWREQPPIPGDFSWSGDLKTPMDETSEFVATIKPVPGLGWYVVLAIKAKE